MTDPTYLSGLPGHLQQEFIQLHKEAFPDLWKVIPEEQIMSELHSMDLRFLAMADTTLDEARSRRLPIWAVGVGGEVCIGDTDAALFIILAGMDNGFKRKEPETHFSIKTFPWTIGRNDSLSLARVLRKRMQKGEGGGRARRVFDALITLLMKGPISISPGPEPAKEDYFFDEPKRPPHLAVVKKEEAPY